MAGVTAMATTLVLIGTAQAQLITYEGFEYATGALEGENGGVGFGGNAWTGSGDVAAATLSFGTLQTSGGSAVGFGANNGGFRGLANTLTTGAGGQSFFLSYLFRGENVTNEYQGLALFNGGSENFFTGKPIGTTELGFVNYPGGGSGTTGSGVLMQSATTYFLVYQFEQINSGANENVRLFVNPGATLGTPNAEVLGGNPFTFGRFRLQGGGPAYSYDEIRIGSTYADVAPGIAASVVPEAGSLTLLLPALGVLGAVVAARRRK